MKTSLVLLAGIVFALTWAATLANQPIAEDLNVAPELAATDKPPAFKEKPPAPEATSRVIDDFSSYRDGQYPTWWRSWPLQRDKVMKVYKVKTSGGLHYLSADDNQDISQQIMKTFVWPVDEMPYLNWRMRPRVLPAGASENDDAKNDSACGVYVIFGRYSGVAAKYPWSTSLPVGSTVSRRDGKLKMQVVGSGTGGLNSWSSFSVNVPASYAKLFGKPLDRKPTGIAVLTDGNATHTAAACDYADFVISKIPLYAEVK